MKAPHDRIQKLAGAFEADLYEVCGNLYGFASAPKTWCNHVVRILLNMIHLTQRVSF